MESLFQILIQKRHTFLSHQDCWHTHSRKLQTFSSWFSTCFCIIGYLDYKIQWSLSSYYWSNQYDHLKILPKRKILSNWRFYFGMLELWNPLNDCILRTLQWYETKRWKKSFRLWFKQIKWWRLYKLYKNNLLKINEAQWGHSCCKNS